MNSEDVLAKSDQELLVFVIVKEVDRARSLQGGGRFRHREQLSGTPCQAAVEVRVTLDALETQWIMEIRYYFPLVCFIIEYVAFLHTRWK